MEMHGALQLNRLQSQWTIFEGGSSSIINRSILIIIVSDMFSACVELRLH